MKKISTTILLVTTFAAYSNAQTNFDLNIIGQINTKPLPKQLYLQEMDFDKRNDVVVDSISVTSSGSFKANYKVKEPKIYALLDNGKTLLYIGASKSETLNIIIDDNEVKTTGSESTSLLQQYEKVRKASFERLVKPVNAQIAMAVESNNQSVLDSMEAVYVVKYNEHKKELSQFVSAKMMNSIAAMYSSLRWNAEADLKMIQTLATNYGKLFPNTLAYKTVKDKYERYKLLNNSSAAPNLILADTTGTTVQLNSLKGKYVLVEFWASWCGPCRVESPHLRQVYKKYNKLGFEIYGVSLDDKLTNWKKAIIKDEMTWTSVSDLKGWKSQAAYFYNVTAISANFLLDRDGKIIDKNLRGKALDEKLKELMGQ
jgi:peroxiredoxin